MSHTPAPWTVDDTLVVNDQLDVEIANISFVDCVDDNRGAWDFGKQSQANALLIAAAPDLLAALQALWNGGYLITFSGDASEAEVKQAAIAAIHKATGAA